MMPRYYINRIGISKTNLASAVETIHKALTNSHPNYICVTNTRTCYLANHDIEYCNIQNNSLLTLPDGMPLIWIARLKGYDEVDRVSGLDLLKEVLNISEGRGFSHYFYGSTQDTIELIQKKLKQEYPDVIITGLESPPFQPIEKFNIQELADKLNELRPSIFWCGLGAPKQERFISLLQPKLNATICIGVGLAFEYYSGTVKRAPFWLRKIGMEWFFRIMQQISKARRFFKPFIWMLKELTKCIFRTKILRKDKG